MTRINRDRTRTATLWLKNESQLTIPEDDWPPATHGNDDKAARVWSEITGLTHDSRMYGDVGDDDILVFGPKADPDHISKYSWQDHELW